jgi:hypothetical protein
MIELRQDGSRPRQFEKSFKAGEAIELSASDTVLQKIPPPAPAAPSQAPAEAEKQPIVEEAAPQPQTIPAAIHKGGGFVVYSAPKAPGRYGFSMELRKGGGFMKSKRLQWFVGYQDTKNYVLFQIDGKHFVVRQVVDGKSEELKKENFDASLDNYLQIEMAIQSGSVSTRLRSQDGSWRDMGTASAAGPDLTQGKVGILISGNDEVAVSSIHFAK